MVKTSIQPSHLHAKASHRSHTTRWHLARKWRYAPFAGLEIEDSPSFKGWIHTPWSLFFGMTPLGVDQIGSKREVGCGWTWALLHVDMYTSIQCMRYISTNNMCYSLPNPCSCLFSPEWDLTYRYRQVLSHLDIRYFHKHASEIIPASGYETFWLLANWQVLFTWPKNCPTPPKLPKSWILQLEIVVYPTQALQSGKLPLNLGVSWMSMFKLFKVKVACFSIPRCSNQVSLFFMAVTVVKPSVELTALCRGGCPFESFKAKSSKNGWRNKTDFAQQMAYVPANINTL